MPSSRGSTQFQLYGATCGLRKLRTSIIKVTDERQMNGNLSFLTLSQLLRLMENSCESIVLHSFCDALTMKDLCTIRKVCERWKIWRAKKIQVMLSNKMQFFNLHVRHEQLKIFVDECFGINFDEPIVNLPQVRYWCPPDQEKWKIENFFFVQCRCTCDYYYKHWKKLLLFTFFQIISHTPGSQMRHEENGLVTFVNTHTNWEDVHGEIIFMREGFDRFSMN